MAPRTIRRSGALAGVALCAFVAATGFGARAFLLPQGSGRRAALASAGVAVLGASASVRAEEPSTTFTKTASGLQQAVIKEGTGVEALTGDLIRVEFNGYLGGFDAKKPFDTTGYTIDYGDRVEKVNKPEKEIVGSSANLKGWNEALAGMKVGETKRIIIPPQLGYGTAGGGGVPPQSTLYYEMTLVWNSRNGKGFMKNMPTSPF
mmetsp:Transcript_67318/g.197637  ORF Transcript_67318/g.197637 Transcript_67318/m.197637 type:complete len:205 (+) Transcript_67318:76-690(+)